jgi:hypothetical protein
MQRNTRNKITFFTFGLLAGVTLGVIFGVAIKALFSNLNALHISLSRIGNKEDQISQRLDSLEGKVATQNKKGQPAPTTIIYTQKSVASPVKDSAVKKQDSAIVWKKQKNSADSVVIPTSGDIQDSGIVIMTNQLVNVSSVSVTNMDSTAVKKTTAQTDSMIASMNNLQEEKSPGNYRIEFWESPLNIKGYKMSKGKLILYGINSGSRIKIVKMDESYYLVSGENAFRVAYTDDFRPFEKVADKGVLKRLSL